MAKKTTTVKAEAVARLADFLATGRTGQGQQPSTDSIRRLAALPLLFEEAGQNSPQSGRVLFDSWAHGGVALRDTTAGHVRRLRLGSGDIGLDLVAERQGDGWQFTARAHSGAKVAHDFVLKVGQKKLLPQSGGYYQWRARGVPRALELSSLDTRIIFEQIAWQ